MLGAPEGGLIGGNTFYFNIFSGFLTIGLPTVYRESSRWYLNDTIESLIKHSSLWDRQREIVVVVFLTDFDPIIRDLLKTKLIGTYQKFIEYGFIQIIEAPNQFYPSFANLKTTYQHPFEQVKWRSKMNVDFAFLMFYSRNMSEFYLQLEDDVVTVPNYVHKIKLFIGKITKEKAEDLYWPGVWACIEFSGQGFLAKLFHSYDLDKLARLLMIFYKEQPNDVILLHFNEMMLQFKRYIRTPTIFYHRGHMSSLVFRGGTMKDLMFNPNSSLSYANSKQTRKTFLPIERRRTNYLQGPEQPMVEERKRWFREIFCLLKAK